MVPRCGRALAAGAGPAHVARGSPAQNGCHGNRAGKIAVENRGDAGGGGDREPTTGGEGHGRKQKGAIREKPRSGMGGWGNGVEKK